MNRYDSNPFADEEVNPFAVSSDTDLHLRIRVFVSIDRSLYLQSRFLYVSMYLHIHDPLGIGIDDMLKSWLIV